MHYTIRINACLFISEVSYDSNVDSEEKSDHETAGFTDDNQSWLKPVTKKKGKQLLGSDGEENHSDSEGSIEGEAEQSGLEGSVEGEEDQSGQEQMSLDEDEDYKVRNLSTH
jgi:hypothetical protein